MSIEYRLYVNSNEEGVAARAIGLFHNFQEAKAFVEEAVKSSNFEFVALARSENRIGKICFYWTMAFGIVLPMEEEV